MDESFGGRESLLESFLCVQGNEDGGFELLCVRESRGREEGGLTSVTSAKTTYTTPRNNKDCQSSLLGSDAHGD